MSAAIALPLVVLLIVLVVTQTGGGDKPGPAAGRIGSAADGDQITYLLIGTRANDSSGQADWLTLMASDPSGDAPVTLFLPTATLTEIPGFGFDSLGKAMALGRVPLQEIAVENMLGVNIDHTLVVPQDLMSRIVDRAGGIQVTVAERLLEPKGNDTLVPVFEQGTQRLDGRGANRYLQFKGQNEDELARFVRAQQVWQALYARFPRGKAADLSRLVSGFGTALLTDATPQDLGAFFSAFAAAGEGAAYRTLPVDAVGSGGSEDAFRVQQTRLDELVRTLLAGSQPPAAPGRGARVQVLNGNGQPEIGLAVADALVPAGFRIVDTGNANSFDYPKTRIVVYREADLPIAQRIKQLIKVGTIEISRTPQSIVDVTVVVGADFVAPQN